LSKHCPQNEVGLLASDLSRLYLKICILKELLTLPWFMKVLQQILDS